MAAIEMFDEEEEWFVMQKNVNQSEYASLKKN